MIVNNAIDFVSLKPARYRMLKSIHFFRSVNENGYSLFDAEIIVTKGTKEHTDNIVLGCIGVFGLELGDIGSAFGLHVEIVDVSERQMEGASFLVKDVEGDAFTFFCRKFSAKLVQTER